MKIAIKILKKELKSWTSHYKYEKKYFKDEEHDKLAIKSFRECREHILDLQHAIIKLENR